MSKVEFSSFRRWVGTKVIFEDRPLKKLSNFLLHVIAIECLAEIKSAAEDSVSGCKAGNKKGRLFEETSSC